MVGKFLVSDVEVLFLLVYNFFVSRFLFRWVCGEYYRYKFSCFGGRYVVEGKWWVWKRIGVYFFLFSLEELRFYFRDCGWFLF